MDDRKLGAVEAHFADLIWESAPIASGELVRRCQQELGWKKPTTYNVLRKLCQRGIFENRDSVVYACISRSDFYARQGAAVIDEAFDGSLPAFLAAFTRQHPLSAREIAQIQQLIDQAGEDAV